MRLPLAYQRGLALALTLFYGNVQAQAGNVFNPKISLILQGAYTHYSEDESPAVPGVLMGDETDLRTTGLALGESELVIDANVDHRFRGWMTVAFEDEDGDTHVAAEEAFIETLALPYGLSLKFGRFLSDLGYLNHIHSHAWDFADIPMAYRALLAGQFSDDGAQLRWLAPTPFMLELGSEVFRGAAYPGGGEASDAIGAWTAFAHTGGDIGLGGAWRAGISVVETQAHGAEIDEGMAAFTGDSRLWVADFVYKWSPLGNPAETNLILQAEYLRRSQRGQLATVDGGQVPEDYAYSGTQASWYAQVVYQFAPQWRTGLRYEELTADNAVTPNPEDSAVSVLSGVLNDRPVRTSLMLDWSPSEFSRLRLQFNVDESRGDGRKDQQCVLQYVFSLGAHPAHSF